MVERSFIETQALAHSKRFCQLLFGAQLSHIGGRATHVFHIFLQPNRSIAGIKPAQNATKFVVNVNSASACGAVHLSSKARLRNHFMHQLQFRNHGA